MHWSSIAIETTMQWRILVVVKRMMFSGYRWTQQSVLIPKENGV